MPRIGSAARRRATLVRLLWLLTLVLVLISVAMVTRRTMTLFGLISAAEAWIDHTRLEAAIVDPGAATKTEIHLRFEPVESWTASSAGTFGGRECPPPGVGSETNGVAHVPAAVLTGIRGRR